MTQNNLNSQPLAFDDRQTQTIDRCLLRLADQTASPLVMVADTSGRLVHCRGRLSTAQSTGLAALAAGGFAAGLEIANFLGLHDGFQQQLLEGAIANLYILAVGPELLLIVAFTRQTMLGMVRLFTKQTRQELLELVEAAKVARDAAAAENNSQLEEGFSDEVEKHLDSFFIDENQAGEG